MKFIKGFILTVALTLSFSVFAKVKKKFAIMQLKLRLN